MLVLAMYLVAQFMQQLIINICAIYPCVSNYFTWNSIPGAIESTKASLMTGSNIMIIIHIAAAANCKNYIEGSL